MVITSKENEIVKYACRLKDRKYRRDYNEFLLEGKRLVLEAFMDNQEISHIFIEEGKSQKYLQVLDSTSADIHIVSIEVAKAIANTVNNQGIFAICKMPNNNINELSNKVLILDNLQDPGNMGTLIRTAAASNFKDLLLINCVDVYNDKVLRSTMGGIFKVNPRISTYEEINELKENNYLIFVADMNGKNIFDLENNNDKFALVIGNEGNGVSEAINNIATNTISIPMQNGVESLNAGVSGSILMYILSKGEF